MYASRRKQLSQNFLTDSRLIRRLIDASTLSTEDTVVEIGPGGGAITAELLRVARQVIAIEFDHHLVRALRRRFPQHARLTLLHSDILIAPLPAGRYKVFANIPFAIEGRIVRKLLDGPNPPDDCYLVVRRTLAERLSGAPHHNQFSLKHQPWFSFSAVHRFRPSDFAPRTHVESLLWRIKRREMALLPADEQQRYYCFIETAFGQGQPIEGGFRSLMPRSAFHRMCAALAIDPLTKPSYLTLHEWLAMYQFVSRGI